MSDPIPQRPTDIDFKRLVDPTKGLVDRRIYSDEEIYQIELDHIFARAWNFMCHESQIPKPGDYFLNYIGDDSVIATRDKKGGLQVLLNTCRHRGNAVCRAESGNARSFLCTYHGWTYDLQGNLVGVPGYKDFYHEDLDKSQWGLIKAAKVASYNGFVFATMDPEAPDLEAFLGEAGRIGLDQMAARGTVVAVDGVQKNVISCNWKLAVDNVFDWYHARITHASAMMSGGTAMPKKVDGKVVMMDSATLARLAGRIDVSHRVIYGEYGHVISGPRIYDEVHDRLIADPDAPTPEVPQDINWRYEAEAFGRLGEVGAQSAGHPHIFPNLWVASNGTQLSLRLPRGVGHTEIWWFTLIDENLPEADKAPWVTRANHQFGPAGLFEQEDGENWDQSTRATRGAISKRYPLNFAMNLGRGEVQVSKSGLAYVDTHVNEHAQLWIYQAWADWMSAASWADLKANRTAAPDARV